MKPYAPGGRGLAPTVMGLVGFLLASGKPGTCPRKLGTEVQLEQ